MTLGDLKVNGSDMNGVHTEFDTLRKVAKLNTRLRIMTHLLSQNSKVAPVNFRVQKT